MALGGEMHDDVGLKIGESARDRGGVADIGLQKRKTWTVGDRPQRGEISRIGELVEHENLIDALADGRTRDRRADEIPRLR